MMATPSLIWQLHAAQFSIDPIFNIDCFRPLRGCAKMRYDRHGDLMSGPLLPRPFILHHPISTSVDVRILREVVEGLGRPAEARCDVVSAVVLRQSIDPTGAALHAPRSRLRWRKNQLPRNLPCSLTLVELIVITVARHMAPIRVFGVDDIAGADSIPSSTDGTALYRGRLPTTCGPTTPEITTTALEVAARHRIYASSLPTTCGSSSPTLSSASEQGLGLRRGRRWRWRLKMAKVVTKSYLYGLPPIRIVRMLS